MDRIERNIPQDHAGVIPQFDLGRVVDSVYANHDQRALSCLYANSFTTTWNSGKCHAQHCFIAL